MKSFDVHAKVNLLRLQISCFSDGYPRKGINVAKLKLAKKQIDPLSRCAGREFDSADTPEYFFFKVKPLCGIES